METDDREIQAEAPPAVEILLRLTPDELAYLCEAIDSHIYWQLSDDVYRHDGYVMDPGADEDENKEAIAFGTALMDRLQQASRR